ncbi:hypothetical protein O181_002885 [Austropuccinia psidii MF-1]|uniref:Uncharacterized protein n=1 Tax=Austropuccinia psidii MF-1 TaxID=1389203 RepID=A0A9Q3BDW0_9BASI|nr:hypothetical protein [Austropuccinia psidii MF-1]
MSSNPMDGSPSEFHREDSGSSSQNLPREGYSIINSDKENNKSIHTDSTGKKSIFIQDLERLGIEDAGVHNASREAQEEIMSVEFKIQQEENQQRARINKRGLQGRNYQITRLVTKNNLLSQASTESNQLCKFIYFLLGIPPSLDDFPPNPTQDKEEFNINWVKIRAKHIKTHLETFEYGLRDHAISENKVLVKQEIASISQGLQPPEFQPSHDILKKQEQGLNSWKVWV